MACKNNKPKTLCENIADSFAPQNAHALTLDSDEEIGPKVVHFNEEEEDFEFGRCESNKRLSEFRKKNIKLLSEQSKKYSGKVSSRSDFEDNAVPYEKSDVSDEEIDDVLEEYRQTFKDCQISDKSESFGTDKEDSVGSSNAEEEDSDYDSNPDETEKNLLSDSERNKNSEIQKGAAVHNQLKLWENLLELRIHSQKMLNKANSFPLPGIFENFVNENEGFSNLAKETSVNVKNLLEKMLDVQHVLASQNTETRDIFKNSRKRSFKQTLSPSEPLSKLFATTLEEDFERFQPYRNLVLLKWDDRMKLLAPGAGAKKKSAMDEFDVITKIDNILLNKNDLVEKSQKAKGNYSLFGYNLPDGEENSRSTQNEIVCPDIYDDTDFYHQQLRELIEFKTNTSPDSTEITKQFAELQKIRRKMKKKVDTRASKGRKIRYVVHNKLVNFMAPNDPSEWTDESKNELYRSLFAS